MIELTETNEIKPERRERVAILFTDIVGFTSFCDSHSPEEVIGPLQAMVESFEDIAEHHQLEKIKTISDAFMAAAGLLKTDADAVLNSVKCGFDMIRSVQELPVGWNVRVGIHFGPVIAGKRSSHSMFGETPSIQQRESRQREYPATWWSAGRLGSRSLRRVEERRSA